MTDYKTIERLVEAELDYAALAHEPEFHSPAEALGALTMEIGEALEEVDELTDLYDQIEEYRQKHYAVDKLSERAYMVTINAIRELIQVAAMLRKGANI